LELVLNVSIVDSNLDLDVDLADTTSLLATEETSKLLELNSSENVSRTLLLCMY